MLLLSQLSRRHLVVFASVLLVACVHTGHSAAPRPSGTTTDTLGSIPPIVGNLIIVGGGQLGPEIVSRFIQLAGGPGAPIIVIPTAGEDSVYAPDWPGLNVLKAAGATNVVLLHTKNRSVAESDSFVAPIRRARGVWFPGGRQWRLVDAYLGTSTERELHALLARGGVIGGTSAGASIQASYLVRGAREGNTIMMAPGYERGFGFITGVAVDQHVAQRKRELDLEQVVKAHPSLLGLGLDESTAIVVHGTRAEVIGRGRLYVHNGRERVQSDTPYVTLRAGEMFDLATRRRVRASNN